ncbi:MAG TPA: hypothetical protein VHM64_02180 [Candidatus Binatia bacterium]|nr:hypothetical protein [Candidatus Binatia bacterium]
MKKPFAALALAAGLATISLPAFANEDPEFGKKQPVRMTDGQLGEITAGALVKTKKTIVHTEGSYVKVEIEADGAFITVDIRFNGKRHHNSKPKFHNGKHARKPSRA